MLLCFIVVQTLYCALLIKARVVGGREGQPNAAALGHKPELGPWAMHIDFEVFAFGF